MAIKRPEGSTGRKAGAAHGLHAHRHRASVPRTADARHPSDYPLRSGFFLTRCLVLCGECENGPLGLTPVRETNDW